MTQRDYRITHDWAEDLDDEELEDGTIHLRPRNTRRDSKNRTSTCQRDARRPRSEDVLILPAPAVPDHLTARALGHLRRHRPGRGRRGPARHPGLPGRLRRCGRPERPRGPRRLRVRGELALARLAREDDEYDRRKRILGEAVAELTSAV